MPIREESFRIGCGRYLQKAGLLNTCGEQILRFGSSPLIIGGKTALGVAGHTIGSSVESVCKKYKISEHTKPCSELFAKEHAAFATKNGYDVIVGVGGGVIMDYAKLVGFFAGLPVVNIPTSSATCAAYTPLSVCYTPEGRTVGTKHFEYEVNAVLADTQILASQPPRLFLAGVFDALAKFLEIKHRFSEDMPDYPLGLDWAYIMAKRSFEQLTKYTAVCLSDMEKGEITDAVERVIFTTIAVTGVISGIARGSNQTALAHKFYENTRKLYPEKSSPYLHGEIVGVGLLLQNHFNNETDNNAFLTELMQKYGMPSSVYELKVDPDAKEQYFELLKNSSSIDAENKLELLKLRAGLDYLFEKEKSNA